MTNSSCAEREAGVTVGVERDASVTFEYPARSVG